MALLLSAACSTNRGPSAGPEAMGAATVDVGTSPAPDGSPAVGDAPTDAGKVGGAAVDAESADGYGPDAATPPPCLQRPVAECDLGDGAVGSWNIQSPIEGATLSRDADGTVSVFGHSAFNDCLFPADACSELRIDFDSDGCLKKVHPPTSMYGGEVHHPGLVECNQRAWSTMRWPCLAGETVVYSETCFD